MMLLSSSQRQSLVAETKTSSQDARQAAVTVLLKYTKYHKDDPAGTLPEFLKTYFW